MSRFLYVYLVIAHSYRFPDRRYSVVMPQLASGNSIFSSTASVPLVKFVEFTEARNHLPFFSVSYTFYGCSKFNGNRRNSSGARAAQKKAEKRPCFAPLFVFENYHIFSTPTL